MGWMLLMLGWALFGGYLGLRYARFRWGFRWQDIETAPLDGTVLLGYAPVWVNADFNPEGILEMFWQEGEGWIGAVWDPDLDAWDTKLVYPTRWTYRPTPPRTTVAVLSSRGCA